MISEEGPSSRQAAILSSVRTSLLVAAYLVLSESVHLGLKNAEFLADLGGAAWLVLAWYVGFACVIGVGVGLAVRDELRQSLLLSLVYYALVTVGLFWLNAPILRIPLVAVALAIFTILAFGAVAYGVRRYSLVSTTPVLFVVAYFNVCSAMAAGWATTGGRLVAFLLAPRSLTVVAVGAVVLPAVSFAIAWLVRRDRRWHLGGHAALLIFLVLVNVKLAWTSSTVRPHALESSTVVTPDLYVMSVDALRRDALVRYVESHPRGRLAFLTGHGSDFANVVADGESTYSILSRNTFAGSTGCAESLPGVLRRRSYATQMFLGRVAKRFIGSECFDYFYSGAGASLATRFLLPRIAAASVASPKRSLRDSFIPAAQLTREVQRHVRSIPATQPVFVYSHYLSMHAPYVPRERERDQAYLSQIRRYMAQCYVAACDPNVPQNASLIRTARDGYEASLGIIDEAAEELYQLAASRGRPFVMVVTADHGELFGEHGGFAHGGGFVHELLNVPYVVYDSRAPTAARRCELMFSSQALRATASNLVGGSRYPDASALRLDSPPLGTATIDRATQRIEFEIAPESRPHAGTWRNIHRKDGTLDFPIASCP